MSDDGNLDSEAIEKTKRIIRTIVWDTNNPIPLGTLEMLKNWIWIHHLCENEIEIDWEIENMLEIGLDMFEVNFTHNEKSPVYNFFNFARRIKAVSEEEIMERNNKFMEKNPRYLKLWKNSGGVI